MASAVKPIDPMDRATREAAGSHAPAGEPVRSYPLRPDFLAFVQVWQQPDGVIYAAKGAPETIVDLCRLDTSERAEVHRIVSSLAELGLRVLGVASARCAQAEDRSPAAIRFEFEGLMGFLDPVRGDVPAALQEAKRAGVSVAMITGDYPATALEIARQAGINTTAGVLTGSEIPELDPAALATRIRTVRVFARIQPEQKLALVDAFKKNGEIVAMTGDGVNDAPALETAHIGIAMGQRGTDVAREASDIVLLDDRFTSIIGGIRLGRRIFANLRKALTFITAIHVPIAGLALAPILLGLPPMLLPMHVVLLELAIDPVCSLVFESERSEKPR
jgi:Ca2+-transporting ATPase